ncbi:MAG: thermonuclease family protein [Candidatus Hydrogenedentes bacterium]|nr:thermonuclease family protein [Candidatus Hydrogenedentota bacterium]
MCYSRYMSFLCCFLFVLVSTTVFAAPDAAVEKPEEAAAQETPPPPVSLIADMTVNEILKSINAPARETYRGTVADVVTGSILVIERNGSLMKVRLYGVDSPEPGQTYYEESRGFAADKFLNEVVNVSVLTTDSQQNSVVLVFNSGGESLSHLMVSEGMAWWDRRNAEKNALLRRLNAHAITHSIGLYADPTALAPWDYRDSRGIESFTYTLDTITAAPVRKTPRPAPKSEPKTISKRGTMTQNAQRNPVDIPKDFGKDIDPMALMGRHQPHIAKDASGKILGLTATDISQIPGAALFGFQNNDIINSVNGMAVESIPQIMENASKFDGVKNFDVVVIRNGQRITIPVNVK